MAVSLRTNSTQRYEQFRKNFRLVGVATLLALFVLALPTHSLGNLEEKYLKELTADGESVSNRYRYAFFLYQQERFAEALDQLDSVFSVNPVHAPSKLLAESIAQVRKIRNETKRVREMAMFMLDQVERAISPDGARKRNTQPAQQLAGQDQNANRVQASVDPGQSNVPAQSSAPAQDAPAAQQTEPLKKMVVRVNSETVTDSQADSNPSADNQTNTRTPSSVFKMPSDNEIKQQLETRYQVKKNLPTQYELDMGEDKFNFEVQRLFIAGNYAKGQNAAVKWIKKYPNSPRARAVYVQALINRNQFKQANTQVISMLKYFPNDLRLKVINDGVQRLMRANEPTSIKNEKELLQKQLNALNSKSGVVQQ